MTQMTRSKTQVLYQYLPGQVFLHEGGFVGKVFDVRTKRSNAPERLVLERLAEQLERWDNRAGFPDPRRSRDRYEIAEPVDEVVVDLWPLTFECSRANCGKIKLWHRLEEFLTEDSPTRCDRCGGPRRQLEYLMVHFCGEAKPIRLVPCDVHGWDWVRLDDTGTFTRSELRCMAPGCNGRPFQRLAFRMCDCGMGQGGDRYMKAVTVRAPNRHQVQHFSFVALESNPIERMRTQQGGDKAVVGAYLDYFPDVIDGLDEARKQAKTDPDEFEREAEKLRGQGIPEDIIERLRKAELGEAQGVFAELGNHVPDAVMADLGRRQKCCERALIFNGPDPERSNEGVRSERLRDFQQRAAELGDQASADRLAEAELALTRHGFDNLLVCTDFPIALAAYGYTRLTSDEHTAMLRSFRPAQAGAQKKPVFVVQSNTEAVFLQLDALRVRDWITENQDASGKTAEQFASSEVPPQGGQARDVKAWLLREAYTESPAAAAVELLVHTLAHTLIRNLGERAGFGEDTMAEYNIPELLTVGLYANIHQDFTLGALVSLVEHNLRSWLEASREGAETCTWDPVCRDTDGACANCLHMAFGCEHWNRELDRAVLFGSVADPGPARLRVARGFWE
jgi:hypothetical protein